MKRINWLQDSTSGDRTIAFIWENESGEIRPQEIEFLFIKVRGEETTVSTNLLAERRSSQFEKCAEFRLACCVLFTGRSSMALNKFSSSPYHATTVKRNFQRDMSSGYPRTFDPRELSRCHNGMSQRYCTSCIPFRIIASHTKSIPYCFIFLLHLHISCPLDLRDI